MLPWIRHLLLLLVAHTIFANKIDKGVDLVEYFEKNKEVSPLEILLQDDKFLRKNAEKHGYINGEWAALLSDSATTTPCSENPRLNNPDCIKNDKHSYISSPDDSRNTQKYEDKYNYDGPRVSPALAHTERYILGKRTKENFRHQELDTTIDRNITATERGIQTEPAQNVDDKTQKTDDRITNTENTFENEDEINYFAIEQNKPLHELDGVQPCNQPTQKVPFYSKEPTQTENDQPNHVTSHGSPSQADQYTQNSKLTPPSNSVYGGNTQDHHHMKSMQTSNDSLGDSIPKEKKTNHALLHRINKKLPDQDTQSNSQSHVTPELNGNAPVSGKDNVNSNIHKEQTHSNIDSSSEDTNRPNSTAPLTREQYGTTGSTVNWNFDDLGNVSSEHDSSGPPELKKTDSEETKIKTAMENEINGEAANSNVTFSTKGNIPGNSTDPYGRVDNNSISSADVNQRSHQSSNELEGTDKNLIDETNSSRMKLPTERPHTHAGLYGRVDSENINNDSSQKHKDISFTTERTSDEPVNYYNVSSNYSDRNNTPSRTEGLKYENISQIKKPKSEPIDVYDVDNKSDKSLAHPSSVNRVVVESRQNKTPQNQKAKSQNVQSEAGPYGLVEPTSLNTQNTSSPANNGSFSNRDQQYQKPESTEITEKTNTQNATGPYGLTDSTNMNVNNTFREDGVSSSEMPPDDTVQAYTNETLVLQKQNETNPSGFVDPVTVGSNNDNQENSFNPSTTKPSLDTQLHQETESKTFTNPELGPYGLVETESVSTNLKPEETRNILSGVDESSIEPAYKKFNNSLNLNYQNISIPQQNISSNEISNKTKDTLQNGKKIGPYVFDAVTARSEPILNNSEINDDELSQGEENPTSGAAEPTFKILHHAKVGNYSSTQPKVLEDTVPKVISENGANIWTSPDGDKKLSEGLIKNNASKTENAEGQLTTPDAENKRTPVSYTADEAQPNRSHFVLECPVQLCYCDSGKPVKGFRLIPF